jgi:MoxR-like ATPase
MRKKKCAVITIAVGGPLENVLDNIFEAGQVPLLAGGTGIGKSQLLESFARRKGWNYRCRDLSLLEPPDLTGLPILDGKVTRYLPPAFLPTTADGDGLLVLEEINRAPAYMRAPCLQFLTARCLNDYVLPNSWRLAAAINPAEDGYDADELDPALEARFVRINVIATPHEWLPWARENKIDERVIAYIQTDADVFGTRSSNPRSWAAVSKLLQAADRLATPHALLHAIVAGCIDPERATAFLAFIKGVVKPLTADDVLRHYKRTQPVLKRWVSDGRLDLVAGTILNVKKRLQSRSEFDAVRRGRSAWRHLGLFFTDLPGDLREDMEAFLIEHEYETPGTRRVN